MPREFIAAALAAIVCVLPLRAQERAVGYDTFMLEDREGRLRLFNQITPENRAALVQTMVWRWLATNRSRLTTAQIEVMEANLASITADSYRPEGREAARALAEQLQVRTAALFSPEEMRQAFTVGGDYIPRQQLPDMSGTWVIVAPEELVRPGQEQTIEQTDDTLTFVHASEEDRHTQEYRLDGQITQNAIAGQVVVQTAWWDGQELLLVDRVTADGLQTFTTKIWSLGEDGELRLEMAPPPEGLDNGVTVVLRKR